MSAVIEKEATGRPKGVALIEFETEEARRIALTLSGSISALQNPKPTDSRHSYHALRIGILGRIH